MSTILTCEDLSCEDYCCQGRNGLYYCCDNIYYRTWWFWFVWASILLIGISCCIGCYRACQSRRRNRYVIMSQHHPSAGYGTVVVSSNTAGTYVPTAPGFVPPYTAPAAPPPYAAYAQEKPPEYS